MNVNVRVPCGQGKTGESIFIYVFPAKCRIKAINPTLLSCPLFPDIRGMVPKAH
jgi:hypothetical protein